MRHDSQLEAARTYTPSARVAYDSNPEWEKELEIRNPVEITPRMDRQRSAGSDTSVMQEKNKPSKRLKQDSKQNYNHVPTVHQRKPQGEIN